MGRNAKFEIVARLTAASQSQRGTVTLERTHGLFIVRPFRARRTFALPLSTVAEMVCRSVLRAEVAADQTTKKRRRMFRRSNRT